MRFVVVTTIQPPTPSVEALAEAAGKVGMQILVVGDRKTPAADWPVECEFVSVDGQLKLDLHLPRLVPENHYSRKNIGYLLAMERGASAIFDTDDDNRPIPGWAPHTEVLTARKCRNQGWVNPYRWFSSEIIWPRGYPLDLNRPSESTSLILGPPEEVRAPIQQGLADGSPDVDAVWRLLFDREFRFRETESLLLAPRAWCPFNSQSTWWFPAAFPLLYLPCLVSFRMTDIWRSFVAQRCLWELGLGVVFHSAEVIQDRNEHDLMRDFEQEIPGYLGNRKLCEQLEATSLSSDPYAIGDNMHRCYESLVRGGFVPADEMPILEAWLTDISAIGNDRSRAE